MAFASASVGGVIFEITPVSRSSVVVMPRRLASISSRRSLIFNSSCWLRATITVSCAMLTWVSVSMLRSLRVTLTPLTTARTLSSGFCSQPQFWLWKSKSQTTNMCKIIRNVFSRKGAKTQRRIWLNFAPLRENLLLALFLQRTDRLARVVRQNDVGAGAFDARERFHHHALFVDPAFLRRRFDQRVLAGDVIRRARNIKPLAHHLQHVEVNGGRLHHQDICAL